MNQPLLQKLNSVLRLNIDDLDRLNDLLDKISPGDKVNNPFFSLEQSGVLEFKANLAEFCKVAEEFDDLITELSNASVSQNTATPSLTSTAVPVQ